jgi:hypothetical protein
MPGDDDVPAVSCSTAKGSLVYKYLADAAVFHALMAAGPESVRSSRSPALVPRVWRSLQPIEVTGRRAIIGPRSPDQEVL